ncbi:MAG: hypothetical protein AAFY81_12310, partial [Pseudomonadota bacterium]
MISEGPQFGEFCPPARDRLNGIELSAERLTGIDPVTQFCDGDQQCTALCNRDIAGLKLHDTVIELRDLCLRRLLLRTQRLLNFGKTAISLLKRCLGLAQLCADDLLCLLKLRLGLRHLGLGLRKPCVNRFFGLGEHVRGHAFTYIVRHVFDDACH